MHAIGFEQQRLVASRTHNTQLPTLLSNRRGLCPPRLGHTRKGRQPLLRTHGVENLERLISVTFCAKYVPFDKGLYECKISLKAAGHSARK
jgi:hypothetical protein